jgi:hypothetical protein
MGGCLRVLLSLLEPLLHRAQFIPQKMVLVPLSAENTPLARETARQQPCDASRASANACCSLEGK